MYFFITLANNLLMQLQADLIGIPVVRPSMPETTALGAAIAAGSADGINVWREEDLTAITTDTFHPLITQRERDEKFQFWKSAVQRTMHWNSSGRQKVESDYLHTGLPGSLFMFFSAATYLLSELVTKR